MKKFLLAIIFIIATTINVVAQEKAKVEVFTGRNCWQIQAAGIATMDNNPLSGEKVFEYGGGLRLIRYSKGFSAIVEGRYQTGRSAILAGGAWGPNTTSRFATSIEVLAGMGEQVIGKEYKVEASGNTSGGFTLADYSKRFKFQAEAAVNLEYRATDKLAFVLSAGIIYRHSEGQMPGVKSKIDLGGSDITESAKALEFKSKKFIPKVTFAVKFRVK